MHFSQMVIVRSAGLLPMLYTPRELGEAIGISPRAIRDWMEMGMPYTRDVKRRIWINGVGFATWVQSIRSKRQKYRLNDDEAYCLRCKGAVKLSDPIKSQRGKLIIWTGTCLTCGAKIHRGVKVDQSR
jgi:hypothetical protein